MMHSCSVEDIQYLCFIPRRIYCLTRAVLETLKYLQYGKLYFQWKLWYQNDENRKHYEKVCIAIRGRKQEKKEKPLG